MTRLRSLVAVTLLFAAACNAPAPERPAAAPAAPRYVDLTHELSADNIFWPTGDTFRLDKVADGVTDKGYYYASNKYSRQRAWRHAHRRPGALRAGARTVDQIPLENLIGAAIVVDVSEASGTSPDYQVTVEDFTAWEKVTARSSPARSC